MTHGSRLPGTTLLRIGRLLFNERFLSAVVQPTVADLQREIAEAGPGRISRMRARWRGYSAFWIVTIASPFATWASPGAMPFPGALAPLAAASIFITIFALVGVGLGAWIIVAITAGALLALALHTWYERHPSRLPTPAEHRTWSPQINFSSTEVAGNVGGLIFAIGSVLIAAIGLPSVMWFLFAATVGGGLLAWTLVAWHTSHPKRGLPENRISLR